jgi:hypothetical protein
MSSPDKPKPRWLDRLRETRKARKRKATARARGENAASQDLQRTRRPPPIPPPGG